MQTVEAWSQMLYSVAPNYSLMKPTGYFLIIQHACQVMARGLIKSCVVVECTTQKCQIASDPSLLRGRYRQTLQS